MCLSADPRDKRLRCSALWQNDTTNVLFDCGPDVRQQLLRAGIQRLDAVVITHEHNDHVIGLDDLRPFIFRQRERIRVYAEPRVQASIRQRFAYAFEDDPYPGAPAFDLRDLRPGTPLSLGTLPPLEPLRVMHGRLPIIGLRLGDTAAYLTDVKTLPAETHRRVRGLHTLVISALHHAEHHSHLNLRESLGLVAELEPASAHLIHMSHHMGFQAEVNAQLPPGVHLGWDGLTLPLSVE